MMVRSLLRRLEKLPGHLPILIHRLCIVGEAEEILVLEVFRETPVRLRLFLDVEIGLHVVVFLLDPKHTQNFLPRHGAHTERSLDLLLRQSFECLERRDEDTRHMIVVQVVGVVAQLVEIVTVWMRKENKGTGGLRAGLVLVVSNPLVDCLVKLKELLDLLQTSPLLHHVKYEVGRNLLILAITWLQHLLQEPTLVNEITANLDLPGLLIVLNDLEKHLPFLESGRPLIFQLIILALLW